eukprot:365289-Rhodomonas_salina.1
MISGLLSPRITKQAEWRDLSWSSSFFPALFSKLMCRTTTSAASIESNGASDPESLPTTCAAFSLFEHKRRVGRSSPEGGRQRVGGSRGHTDLAKQMACGLHGDVLVGDQGVLCLGSHWLLREVVVAGRAKRKLILEPKGAKAVQPPSAPSAYNVLSAPTSRFPGTRVPGGTPGTTGYPGTPLGD